MFDRIVLSCEHARNRIPARYAHLFDTDATTLEGHRGYDLGALEVARFLSGKLGVPLFSGSVSRLLVDLNRSIGNSALFSQYVRDLGAVEKVRILERHYHPCRHQVEEALVCEIGRCRVLHLSIHSFTPEMDGRARRVDVGLLYDPSRVVERQSCLRMIDSLHRIDPTLDVRRNYPYRGTNDGFTTHLRKALRSDRYAGIEIELNQARIAWARERRHIAAVLQTTIREELSVSAQPGRVTRRIVAS